jgi:L-threonylcarbamoyladenylate synthase
MRTRVLRVDPENPSVAAIADAAMTITHGGLVAFPTETVYGLGAHALDERAVRRIFEAKGRPSTDPVIVHIAQPDDLRAIATEIPDRAWELARAFWPGALTLILRRQPTVPLSVTAGLATVGVRVPSHPVARALLRAAAVPIAAPSANRFARPSPTRAAHVMADLEGRIDIVLDGGDAAIGVESTIVDLTVDPPLIRRPGGVSLAAIARVVPDVAVSGGTFAVDLAQPAPGQLLRHYAPRAPLVLYVGSSRRVSERLAHDARAAAAAGERVGLLAPAEDLVALAPRIAASAVAGRIVTMAYGSRRQPGHAAHELFAALRDLDGEGVDRILASASTGDDEWLAIVDRLTRAAEGRVIHLEEPG